MSTVTSQRFVIITLLLLVACSSALAQTGRIDGTAIDQQSGEPLPGVNVLIRGTNQGATTDPDGYYTIINVSPGTYVLEASFIGYTSRVVEDVRVNIGLTTTIDFELAEEAVGLEDVIVVAERPVVQRDVSANVANVSMAEIENIPVTSVEGVIGLQAGIEPGIQVRGGGLNQLSFNMDGMSMRDSRDNTPFTGISYTAIEEVQVQTGGFNAEYGNVRSGLINLTMREGSRERYTADVIYRYSPVSRKHFGGLPNDPDAYWMRPFVDDEVAWAGTDDVWDIYTRRQYPQWMGWDQRAAEFNAGRDASEHMTPQQLQEVFEYYHRKSFEVNTPDYEVDASVGGPIPGIGPMLGNLRFFASYRQTQGAYIIPTLRDSYQDRTGQIKLTTEPGRGMRLNIHALLGHQAGINTNAEGWPDMRTGDLPTYPWSQSPVQHTLVNVLNNTTWSHYLFADHFWSEMDVSRNMVGVHLTQMLGEHTFYDVRFQRMESNYDTGPGRERDRTIIHQIGSIELDEAPFGWSNVNFRYDPSGSPLKLEGRWGAGRDTSRVVTWSTRGDITSQVNRYSQLKVGLEFLYTDFNSRHGNFQITHPSLSRPTYIWHRQTSQGAAYVQNKFEFEGMVANVGLRLDYFQPLDEWYLHDPFDRAFASNTPEEIEQGPIDRQLSLSPRLGISFPITEHSKLYFNYGHFRSMLDTPDLFRLRTIFDGASIDQIGNPNHPMPRTVAYELGYDQNLFGQYLLRLSGYYRAESLQPRWVNYQSMDGAVSYSIREPLNYGDTRGVEFTLTKMTGDWIRGFVNYTYMVRKVGNFGFNIYYENPYDMRTYIMDTQQHYQSKPVPEPYARFNLEFRVPTGSGIGPSVGDFSLLEDWRLSFLGEWRSGQVFTYTAGQTLPGLQNNMQWRDYYMLDMRLSRNFNTSLGSMQLFVDMTNVLNLRHLNRYSGWIGARDLEFYMESLHLPEGAYEDESPYLYIPGNDRPGDYRKPGVAFHPIHVYSQLPDAPSSDLQDAVTRREAAGRPGPLFYDLQNGQYYDWAGDAWVEADQGVVDQVIRDKAYIDMPNGDYFSFLNPRNVFLGVRINL